MRCKFLIAALLLLTTIANATELYHMKSNSRLLKEPNEKGEMIQELNINDTLSLISKDTEWCKVKANNGDEGYVMASLLIALDDTSLKQTGMPIGGRVLFITLVVIVIGIILGFTKLVTIYPNYSDLALTFGVVIVLLLSLIFSAQIGNPEYKYPFVPYISIVLDVILLIWLLIRAIQQNNIVTGIIAFIVKIPLIVSFIYYIFRMLTSKRVVDRVDGGLKAGVLALLMNGLVRNKVWEN